MVVFANAGVPMVCIGLPYMALVLAPVVLIEAAWYRRILRLPWPRACRGSLTANLQSTFLGLPVAWFVWTFAGRLSVALASAWGLMTREQFLYSYPAGLFVLVGTSGWLDPPAPGAGEVLVLGAGLVLLLPAYLVSYLWEARVLRREWPDLPGAQVRRRVWQAHLLSYGLLYALAGAQFYAVAWAEA
jgi:hypothetical protein